MCPVGLTDKQHHLLPHPSRSAATPLSGRVQGTLTLLSSLSMGWLPAESVKAAYLLAPVAFLGNLSADFVRRAATIDFDVVSGVCTSSCAGGKSLVGGCLWRLHCPGLTGFWCRHARESPSSAAFCCGVLSDLQCVIYRLWKIQDCTTSPFTSA